MASASDDHPSATSFSIGTSRIWRPTGSPEIELLHGHYRNFSFSKHFHSVAAIGVVDQGTMSCYWEGKEYDAPAGTVILFNAGDVHAPRGKAGDPWSFRMLYMDRPLSLEVFGHDSPFRKPFVKDNRLAANVLRTHRRFRRNVPAMESEIALLALSRRLRPHLNPKPREQREGDESVERARDYIHAHYAQNISLRLLANEVQLSPFYLARNFREHYGIPPHLYLLQVRVERAQALLRSGAPIADVAAQTGFVDQSHFTRHFKRISGVTPGQYSSE
jgi:AraC-like DNA-binding protein